MRFLIHTYWIGPLGHEVKSLESMTISPNGDTAGFLGPSGSLHLLSTRTKQWNMHLRMNSAARAIAFLGDNTLLSSGLDADVYVWDIRRPGKCINRYISSVLCIFPVILPVVVIRWLRYPSIQ